MNEKKETKKEKLPSLGTMNQYAKESIKKLISLQNDDKKSLNGSRLAMQKKIMARLEKEASNGSATMGLAVMKGMVVTGINFSRFFDYTSPYKDNRGFDKIEEFAMFENIVPLMMKYKTIQKADTVMQFIRILPDLNELPFSTELYDVLNEVTEGEKSFQTTLFDRWRQEYRLADPEVKPVYLSILKRAVMKGYSGAALSYADVLQKEQKSISPTVL
ncbi:MAG: hypothetical protein IJD25_01880, partial [Alphaproteobacteria bacterium]|nr:hypothetical protein [Alphaproteobacteria bacterium]